MWLKVLRDLELLPRLMNQDWSWIWLQKFDGHVTILVSWTLERKCVGCSLPLSKEGSVEQWMANKRYCVVCTISQSPAFQIGSIS